MITNTAKMPGFRLTYQLYFSFVNSIDPIDKRLGQRRSSILPLTVNG